MIFPSTSNAFRKSLFNAVTDTLKLLLPAIVESDAPIASNSSAIRSELSPPAPRSIILVMRLKTPLVSGVSYLTPPLKWAWIVTIGTVAVDLTSSFIPLSSSVSLTLPASALWACSPGTPSPAAAPGPTTTTVKLSCSKYFRAASRICSFVTS